MVKQLNGEGDALLAAESGSSIDNTAWSEHDAPLFPLVESELDNYWNTFDPFESAAAVDPEDRCPATGTPPGLQEAVKRQINSPSPPPPPPQQAMYSAGIKRPRGDITSPVLLQYSGDRAEQSPAHRCRSSSFDVECQCTTPRGLIHDDSTARTSSLSDVVDCARSSSSSIDIPLGLLSSLPPNCNVYITHRPASVCGQKSSSPVTQIIINNARPSSTLPPPPPPSNTLHYRAPCCMPSLQPLPALPLSPPMPPPPTAVNQFHPLNEVRPRELAPSSSFCRNKAPLTTVARPPKSLSTYAAEFRHLGVGVDDVSTWAFEASRRGSDSAMAAEASSLFADGSALPDIADRRRHHSSTFLPTSKIKSSATMMLASSSRSSANSFQRPTSLPVSPSQTLHSVFRQQRREPSFCASNDGPQSLSGSWQHGKVEDVVQSPRTPTMRLCQTPQTPGDETDENLMVGVSRSCLGDSTADSSSSGGDSGSDGGTCLLSSAIHHMCASSSSSPSSLVEGSDNQADLPSPVLSTVTAASAAASAKPRQRTIDALSKKIRRNQTRNTSRPKTVVSKETFASTVTKPDSSCPTPPPSRQRISTSFSSSASLSPSDASEISAVSGYSKPGKQKVPSKNEYAEVGNSDNRGNLSTTSDNNNNVVAKDPVLPSKRKRTARQKSQAPRQLPANDAEKVIIAPILLRHYCTAIAVCDQKYQIAHAYENGHDSVP